LRSSCFPLSPSESENADNTVFFIIIIIIMTSTNASQRPDPRAVPKLGGPVMPSNSYPVQLWKGPPAISASMSDYSNDWQVGNGHDPQAIGGAQDAEGMVSMD